MAKKGAKIISFFLLICMVLSTLPMTVVKAGCGTRQNALNWVYAQEGKALDYDGVYGAQCVDLINYYYKYLGVSVVYGNAYQFASNSLPAGWTRIQNTPSFVPQPGDIAVWGTSVGNGNGHVAIILSATVNNFVSMDQNWGGKYCKQVNHNYNGFWGVIRPNFDETPQNTPSTQVSVNAWFTDSVVPGKSMGPAISSDKVKKNGVYYLCYELINKGTGKRYDGTANYNVKETVSRSNNTQIGTYTYQNSPYNWIRFTADTSGTITGKIEVSGRLSASASATINVPNVERIEGKVWFSTTSGGTEVENLEKGKQYYVNYLIRESSSQKPASQVMVLDYSVKLELVDPSGKATSNSYNNTDAAGIKFTARAGTYSGKMYLNGSPTASLVKTITCKEPNVLATGITLNKKEVTLGIGETLMLTATISPPNVTDKTVSWSSGDASIASVDKGMITARKKGTTIITARTSNGREATCKVTVKPNTVAVTSIKLNDTNCTLNEGDTSQLIATVLPENATNKEVVWSSSDLGVATVSSQGKINAVKAGICTITVTTVDGGKIAKCQVKVNPVKASVIGVEAVELNKYFLNMYVGEKSTLIATVLPENATNKGVSWKSSDPGIVKVSDGVVEAVSEGTASIIVTTQDGNRTATCQVVIKRKDNKTENTNNDTTQNSDSEATINIPANIPANSSDDMGTSTRDSYNVPANSSDDAGTSTWDSFDDSKENNGVESGEGTVTKTYYDDPDDEDENTYVYDVGDEIETDTAVFVVTKCDGEDCEVEYLEPSESGASTVKIPKSIEADGVMYRVTSIASSAFNGDEDVKSVTIGSNIKKIGTKAFYGCKNLKSIIINTTSLSKKTIGNRAFKGVSKKVTVRVPKSKLNLYKTILKSKGIGSKAKFKTKGK